MAEYENREEIVITTDDIQDQEPNIVAESDGHTEPESSDNEDTINEEMEQIQEMQQEIQEKQEAENGDFEFLDPGLVDALEQTGHEEMLVEFNGSGSTNGDERIDFAREFFPENEDYRDKTLLTTNQIFAATMLRTIPYQFPELDLGDMDIWIEELLNDFERYASSRDGFARKQEENILRAMFGENTELSSDEGMNFLAQALSNPPDDGDE